VYVFSAGVSGGGPAFWLAVLTELDTTEPSGCELTLQRAETMFARSRGLLGQRRMASGQALWLKPCFAVHTVGMRFSIGVFFIDKHGVVVKTIARLRPNRLAACWQANSVVETAAFDGEQTETLSRAVMQAIARVQLS
jgi:uncharacterized membrane protein (UPF0127 family)